MALPIWVHAVVALMPLLLLAVYMCNGAIVGRQWDREGRRDAALMEGYANTVTRHIRFTRIIKDNHVHHFKTWTPSAACHSCGQSLEETLVVL